MGAQPWWGRDVRMLRTFVDAVPTASRGSVPPDAPYWLDTDAGPLSSNPCVTSVEVMPAVLSGSDCEHVLQLARSLPFERGGTLEREKGYRECHCAWIPPDESSRWMYDRLMEAFEAANRRFRFRLTGMIEPAMAVAYGPGDKFDWHLDAGEELTANRKLSLSILLAGPSIYEGGALEFCGVESPGRHAEGTAVVFPSFLPHRVTPVTRGRRIALVAFAYGATFT